MNKTKVIIVDDHAILRMGLVSLLSTRDDIEVIGDASDGKSALRKAQQLQPDLVIMDLIMPKMDGVAATRELRALMPEIKVLILTTFGTSDGIARALEAGAGGAIMKNASLPELANAIRTVARGGSYLTPEIKRMLAENPPITPLSPRQLEILRSLVRGLSNNDIALELGIGVDMVKKHTKSLFAKIGAANRAEAVAIALQRQLLKLT